MRIIVNYHKHAYSLRTIHDWGTSGVLHVDRHYTPRTIPRMCKDDHLLRSEAERLPTGRDAEIETKTDASGWTGYIFARMQRTLPPSVGTRLQVIGCCRSNALSRGHQTGVSWAWRAREVKQRNVLWKLTNQLPTGVLVTSSYHYI